MGVEGKSRWAKMCATKPDDLSSSLQTYKEETKKWLSSQMVVAHAFKPRTMENL